MTHFFDPATHQPIKELKVSATDVAKVGLKMAPIGRSLNVTTWSDLRAYTEGDTAVRLLKRIAADEEIYEVTGPWLKSMTLRAFSQAHQSSSMQDASWLTGAAPPEGSAPKAELAITRLPNPSGKPKTRRAIVDLARTFVARSHYLWGTAGNKPGFSDGNSKHKAAATIRPVCLDAATTAPWPDGKSNDPVLGINQAFQPWFDRYNSCAGRSSRSEVAFTPAPGKLEEYLKERQEALKKGEVDTTRWPGLGPRGNLYPRRFWKSVHGLGDKMSGDVSGIVWGEACQGVPHFDCVGLVNYCYGHFYWKGEFEREIAAFKEPNSGTREMKSDKDLMDADIVIPLKGGHIGMIYEVGPGVWNVVQAEETVKGLTDTAAYIPEKWERFRMDARYLVDDPP